MLKKILKRLSKKFPVVNKVRHKYVVVRNRILRFYYARLSVNDKTVFFESYMGHSYACSPRAIYEYMLNHPEYSDYKFIWSFRKPQKYNHLLDNERTSVVMYRTPQYYRALAKSKYWVVNGWIPTLLKKKPSQIMVQAWHGTPLKRLRNDLKPDSQHATLTYKEQVASNKIDTARYDYFISPSRFASKAFTSAFALRELNKEDIIIETGYPRNDFLFSYKDSDVSSIKKRFNLPSDKKVVLYAPTWRDDQHQKGKGFTYKLAIDFDKLKRKLGNDYIIIFRSHYNIAEQFDFSQYEGFVYDGSKVDDVSELYVVSDILITDYSSVFFDFANLHRPMVFFMYDLDHYEKDLRGFYFNIKELPGPIVKTNDELVDTLLNISTSQKKYDKLYKDFSKKYNYLDDANASQRVVERVFR